MAHNLLWMTRMSLEGLTGDMLLEENKEDIAPHFQFSSVGGNQLDELQEKCRVRLGLPKDWEDTQYMYALSDTIERWRKMPSRPYKHKKIEGKKEPKSNKPIEIRVEGGLFDGL